MSPASPANSLANAALPLSAFCATLVNSLLAVSAAAWNFFEAVAMSSSGADWSE